MSSIRRRLFLSRSFFSFFLSCFEISDLKFETQISNRERGPLFEISNLKSQI
jgi:hypothetical protein